MSKNPLTHGEQVLRAGAGKVGQTRQGARNLLPFSRLLLRIASRLPPTPKREPKVRPRRKHKLTDEQVRALRQPLKRGELARLAREFGVEYGYAWHVKEGELRGDVL